jgi:hypothetical protein
MIFHRLPIQVLAHLDHDRHLPDRYLFICDHSVLSGTIERKLEQRHHIKRESETKSHAQRIIRMWLVGGRALQCVYCDRLLYPQPPDGSC